MASLKFNPSPHTSTTTYPAISSDNMILASKLRKIKCKLDETSTKTSSSQPSPITYHPPPQPQLQPQPSQSPSSSSSSSSSSCNNNQHQNLHLHQFNSTKHFQFESDPISFDRLIDQFIGGNRDNAGVGSSINGCNRLDEEKSRLISLKNVQYSENVSRQSSIRSLVNSATTNPAVNNRLTKIINAKTANINNNLSDKHEYDLINDWDVVYHNSGSNRFVLNIYKLTKKTLKQKLKN